MKSIALLVVLLVLVSCGRGADETSGASYQPPEDEQRTIASEAMTITRSLLVPEIRGAGIAEGIREAWVVSEAEGLVRDVRFNLGDRVDEGQILAILDSDLARRNRDLAEQQYATANLEFQAADPLRLRRSFYGCLY